METTLARWIASDRYQSTVDGLELHYRGEPSYLPTDVLAGPGHWSTLDEIARANETAGRYWFTASAMHFFRTRLDYGQRIVAGRFFVASHQAGFEASDGRLWAVHYAGDGGEVGTVGTLSEGFGTRREAVKAARDLAHYLYG